MQTFLPLADFQKSAEALDRSRLGKQRAEALQLVRGQWHNHPASKMWRGHEYQLAEYGKIVCRVWIARGYQDTCLEKFCVEQAKHQDTGLPRWFGNPAFHLAHQSKLRSKLPAHYCQLFPDAPDGLEYIWPGDQHA